MPIAHSLCVESFARTPTDFFESVRFTAGMMLVGSVLAVAHTLVLVEGLVNRPAPTNRASQPHRVVHPPYEEAWLS